MLHVLGRIRAATHRPGAIRASLDGLTTQVLNERLQAELAREER